MQDRNTTPVEYRQLCAIAKTIIQQEPSIDDAEWKARVRDTLAKWGFAEPDADQLVRAMNQVEYALRKTIGPRPVREIPVPMANPYVRQEPTEPTHRTNHPAGWNIVVGLMAKLQQARQPSPASVPSSAKPAGPRETLAISEEDALVEFWRASGDLEADRLSLLKAFSELAIVRPEGWDTKAIRANSVDPRLRADGCFSCRRDARSYHWHHVIQIQHGGSNYVRNRVPLCSACHASVHPWLSGLSRERATAGNWFQVAGVAPAVLEMLRRKESA